MIKDNRMIYPPIAELTEEGKFNRYQLVIGVAKGARMVTDEYLVMRERAEKAAADPDFHDAKAIANLIDPDFREQKAIRIAITRLHDGKYRMAAPGDEED